MNLPAFLQIVASTIVDIAPIIGIILGFQLLVIRKPIHQPKQLLVGVFYVLLGISLFLQGLDMALFPLGELMATQLTSSQFIPENSTRLMDYFWVYIFAASIGFASTLAEPALIAVADRAEDISTGAINATKLRLAVSIGVSFGVALGVFRIISGGDLYLYIMAGYALVVVQTAFSPKIIIGLAYDCGGITTSTVTVPLVAALGLGLAQSIPGRDPILDGFGLIAFASLFPIITVLAYAQLAHWHNKRRLNP